MIDLLTRERLTAPHYLAYSFVVDHIDRHMHACDFGCGTGKLPEILNRRGVKVTGVDRRNVVNDHRCLEDFVHQHGLDGFDPFSFDAVISVWAMEHNRTLEDIHDIAVDMGLIARKRIVIVSKYGPKTRYETARADPVWVLNWDDRYKHVITPCFAFAVKDVRWFWYEHASVNGEWCKQEEANAVGVCLERVQR